MPITATFLILENSILKLILMQHILSPYRPWDLCLYKSKSTYYTDIACQLQLNFHSWFLRFLF